MANKLNRDKPYGEVFGGGRVRFVQEGRNYDFLGELVPSDYKLDKPLVSNADKRRAKEQAKADAKAARREAFLKPVTVAEPEAVAEPPEIEEDDDWLAEEPKADDYESLHWTKLRKLVEDAGGTYAGKDEAVTWLRANV